MSRKHGCEKKPAFDHFSRDLGVDPFLPQMWVASDSPTVKPVVPRGSQGQVCSLCGLTLFFLSATWDKGKMLLTSPCSPEDVLKDRVLGATHSLRQAARGLPGGRAARYNSCPVHCGSGLGCLLITA